MVRREDALQNRSMNEICKRNSTVRYVQYQKLPSLYSHSSWYKQYYPYNTDLLAGSVLQSCAVVRFYSSESLRLEAVLSNTVWSYTPVKDSIDEWILKDMKPSDIETL